MTTRLSILLLRVRIGPAAFGLIREPDSDAGHAGHRISVHSEIVPSVVATRRRTIRHEQDVPRRRQVSIDE